jgi:hypothetical protein
MNKILIVGLFKTNTKYNFSFIDKIIIIITNIITMTLKIKEVPKIKLIKKSYYFYAPNPPAKASPLSL